MLKWLPKTVQTGSSHIRVQGQRLWNRAYAYHRQYERLQDMQLLRWNFVFAVTTGNACVCWVCRSWPTETSSWKCRTHPPLTASFLPVENTQNHNRPLARLRLIGRSFIFALLPLFFTVYFRGIVKIWFSLNRSLAPVPILFDSRAYRRLVLDGVAGSVRGKGRQGVDKQTEDRQETMQST